MTTDHLDPPSTNRADTARANGAKSRGPKTLAGKLNSRRNGLRHGHTARLLTLDSESDEGFALILADLEADLQPQTSLEEQQVVRIAWAHWRTLRTWSQEKSTLDRAMREVNNGEPAPDCAGQALRHLADTSRILQSLDLNENRYERIYHRTLREFFRLRLLREKIENAKTNPPTHSKQTPAEKTNPAALNLLRAHVPSELLEARIAAWRDRQPKPEETK